MHAHGGSIIVAPRETSEWDVLFAVRTNFCFSITPEVYIVIL